MNTKAQRRPRAETMNHEQPVSRLQSPGVPGAVWISRSSAYLVATRWLDTRWADRHRLVQGDVAIDRAHPVLQLLEAQAVAELAVRPDNTQLDMRAGQLLVQ